MSTPSTPLRLIAFDGGWNLPIWAAQRNGYFETAGLAVTLTYTANSGELVAGLLAGQHDIAFAGADNFVAYRDGAGEGTARAEPDLFMFMGGDGGFLSLIAAPGITEVTDLRGRSVAVDAMATGFAFVVRELLARRGVPESDVCFKRAGGTSQRYAALIDGRFDATLLRTPFDLLAVERGFHRLATGGELGPYQGTVGAARRSWADASKPTLKAFLRAYHQGLAWCFDSGNRPMVEALLLAHVKDLDAHSATVAAAQLLSPTDGLSRDMRIDPQGLQTVLALRRKYSASVTTRADDYFAHTFLDEALRA